MYLMIAAYVLIQRIHKSKTFLSKYASEIDAVTDVAKVIGLPTLC